MADTPNGRRKNVLGQGNDIHKKGEGLGTGPVGQQHGGRPTDRDDDSERAGLAGTLLNAALGGGSSSSSSGGGLFKGKGLLIIIVLVLLLGGGGSLSGLFGNLFGGGGSQQTNTNSGTSFSSLGGLSSLFGGGSGSTASTNTSSSALSASALSSVFSGSGTSTGWSGSSQNTAKLNTSVSPEARAKRTTILGNKKDVITIMVYMCGTDLESQYKMGTADLSEMIKATVGENINLIVYTGGCRQWRVNGISNTTNQIWQVKNGQLVQLVADAGNKAMTKPGTLAEYIQFCKQNFPANRNMLIFWDHGGGSLSGYGYDERFASTGSMPLSGIQQALKAGGVTFDFIGFDACLMATAETALMCADYADYLIGSEETEPGIGWYYTNWLTKLSANTSMSTLEIGKNIVDDFVDTCAKNCQGQKATLSVIDLAELEKTLPDDFKAFATATSEQIKSDYKTVSNARSGAREFAQSTKIDQVDLVDLANKLGTKESKAMASTVLDAVKYNRTSTNMTNAYGLSIYFPYQKVGKVDSAVKAFEAIGMDSDYMRCIQTFASVETGGQAISGGASSPLGSLLSGYSGSAGQTASGSDMISSILGGLMGGNTNGVSGLSGLASSFLSSSFGSGRALSVEDTAKYLENNRFDASKLDWTLFENGMYGIALSDDQWKLVQKLQLNVFLDDGKGYIDLGYDDTFTINAYGVLLGDYDYSWLTIGKKFVAYYLMDTLYDGDKFVSSMGYVPAMLKKAGSDEKQRVELIIVFDEKHPNGYVAGAKPVYVNGETDTVAKTLADSGEQVELLLDVNGQTEISDKALLALEAGDTLEFLCDYYSYKGEYQDTYVLDDIELTEKGIESELAVGYYYLSENNKANAKPAYLFTDIYKQEYWSPILPK